MARTLPPLRVPATAHVLAATPTAAPVPAPVPPAPAPAESLTPVPIQSGEVSSRPGELHHPSFHFLMFSNILFAFCAINRYHSMQLSHWSVYQTYILQL